MRNSTHQRHRARVLGRTPSQLTGSDRSVPHVLPSRGGLGDNGRLPTQSRVHLITQRVAKGQKRGATTGRDRPARKGHGSPRPSQPPGVVTARHTVLAPKVRSDVSQFPNFSRSRTHILRSSTLSVSSETIQCGEELFVERNRDQYSERFRFEYSGHCASA